MRWSPCAAGATVVLLVATLTPTLTPSTAAATEARNASPGFTWHLVEAAGQPPQRYAGSMVFDRERDELVISGGFTWPGSSTWSWDGDTWRDLEVTSPGSAGMAQAYDPIRHEIVQFTAGGELPENETWVFDGSTWIQRHPAVSPPKRYNHAIAFDPQLGKVVVYGGLGFVGPDLEGQGLSGQDLSGQGLSALGDMWAWDGTTWEQLHPAHTPGPRHYAGLAFDRASGRLVLHGGAPSGQPYLRDTWTWDGSDWSRTRSERSAPPGGNFATFKMGRHVAVFRNGNVWRWRGDSESWRRLETGPVTPGRVGYAQIAFDPVRRQTVLFGGTGDGPDDTWVLERSDGEVAAG